MLERSNKQFRLSRRDVHGGKSEISGIQTVVTFPNFGILIVEGSINNIALELSVFGFFDGGFEVDGSNWDGFALRL